MKIPNWFYEWAYNKIDYARAGNTPYVLAWKAYQKGKRKRGVCEWEYIDTEKCFAFEKSYKTKCGDIFVVASIADYAYCPVCGKRIKVKERA